MTFLLVARDLTETNELLLAGLRRHGVHAAFATPAVACRRARPQDVALGRLDVLPSLDGVDEGLWQLARLERAGTRVLNRPFALLAAHDKLATALRLGRFGVPHPRTAHIDDPDALPDLEPPLVIKPRFGSWGRDVVLCPTRRAVERSLRRLRSRRWFRRHGALVQELVPSQGCDLRVVVAVGEVVGAVERRSSRGEWRTNVALGGSRAPLEPDAGARLVALAAAAAVGADLVGVDLLPDQSGGYVVLEVNGAVDFTHDYSLGGRDVFEDAAAALAGAATTGLASPADALAAV
jgi:[lysine-biosynthesis-protein LysW]--L-2-aminoadipate ligase